METITNYSLSLRRGKNSFSPIEWTKLRSNNNPNANKYSLQDIDEFTSGITESILIRDMIDGNFASLDDYITSIEIIYYENGNTRSIPEGPCFIEDSEFLDVNNIINYITLNITDLQLMNKLYNYLNKYVKEDNTNYLKFVKLLNYSHEIVKEGDSQKLDGLIKLLIKYINSLSYLEKRRIGMYISKKLVTEKHIAENRQLIYNNSDDKR